MRKLLKNCAFIFILLLFAAAASGQTRTELEKRKKQLEKDIRYTQKILSETKEKRTVSQRELRALQTQIKSRLRLIRNINAQVNVLDRDISVNRNKIDRLRGKLEALRKEYAVLVKLAFRNKNSYSKLMFIFASKDFQQAFRRVRYLKDISQYRRKQADYIKEVEADLNAEITGLTTNKNKQVDLLQENKQQQSVLDKERLQQTKVVSKLRNSEEKLKDKVAQQQRDLQRLQAAIDAAIEREIEAAKKAAAAAAAARGEKPPVETSSTSSLALTPEAKKLSADFVSNRGKLPWPVERGVIVSSFGTHEHSVLPGIMVNNPGVDIETEKGAVARAVFAGEVVSVVQISGNLAVLVRHGEYFSVYSNLKSVMVSRGDKVSIKQPLGVVRSHPEEGTILKFMISKGKAKLNPAGWLYRK